MLVGDECCPSGQGSCTLGAQLRYTRGWDGRMLSSVGGLRWRSSRIVFQLPRVYPLVLDRLLWMVAEEFFIDLIEFDIRFGLGYTDSQAANAAYTICDGIQCTIRLRFKRTVLQPSVRADQQL